MSNKTKTYIGRSHNCHNNGVIIDINGEYISDFRFGLDRCGENNFDKYPIE